MKWTADMIEDLRQGQSITIDDRFLGKVTKEIADIRYINTDTNGKRFVGLSLYLGGTFADSTKCTAAIREGDEFFDAPYELDLDGDGVFVRWSEDGYSTPEAAQKLVTALREKNVFALNRHYNGRFYIYVQVAA